MMNRIDTLFLRLFVMMWVVLVISHLVAFSGVMSLLHDSDSGDGGPSMADRVLRGPPLPSLPPTAPRVKAEPPPPDGGPMTVTPPAVSPDAVPDARPVMRPGARPIPPDRGHRSMGSALFALDYALRALLIGLGAWLGARWLSGPMRRLARAAHELPQDLEQGQRPPVLDEAHGTVEVRETAKVFNQMAQRLQRQFDQRSLHMAAVSHDLRTPLTRLRLRLESLPPEQAQAAVADLHEMDELIETSLAVMREQSGGSDAAAVDLTALLQSLVDDRIELGQAVSLQDPLPTLRVQAHPASLRRILDNLVGNALRYGQRAAVGVEVGDERLQVVVDDNGPGIPPERMERVFEPWVRGALRPGGNGLGLAIARDLARREGGDVSLANRSQGGLRATLTLPLPTA